MFETEVTLAKNETGHPTAPAPAEPRQLSLRFTGSGGEYFRIWIVNLLLTVVTLGIYSAWAKVRRLQYFDRNTELDGAVFDFTGSPMAVLRGRIFSILLLGLYQFAIGFSVTGGVVVAVLIGVLIPYFGRGAMRFRLANTSYRGLRFRFTGSVRGAYAIFLPAVSTVLIIVALAAVSPKLMGLLIVIYLLWPLMHAALKRYQFGNVAYGSLHSSSELSLKAFYKPYGVAIGTPFLALVVGGIIVGIMSSVTKSGMMGNVVAITALAIVVYALALLGIPYLTATLANRTWSVTRFPGVTLRSELPVWGMFKLMVINTLLTLITLGLYRPFAVVNMYRFRLEHLTVIADHSVDEAVASGSIASDGASGDGMADFLDFDLSW